MADPFNRILETIREEGRFYNEPPFFIGTIKSSFPNLEILWANRPIHKSQILIDKTLLDRHNVSISCSNGTVSHNLKDTLNVGDTVIMLRNGDKFIIISKVVSI